MWIALYVNNKNLLIYFTFFTRFDNNICDFDYCVRLILK